MAQFSKTAHITAVTKVAVTDLSSIAGRPDLNLASQLVSRPDTVTPPKLNVQIAMLFNLTQNNDPSGITGTTPRV